MANPHENDDIDPEVCWDGAEDGIPNMSDPFIRAYLHGRDALIFQERKLRSDHAFRQSLSPIAAEASTIVANIRDEEQHTVWTNEFEDRLAEGGEGNTYPGMMFTLAKSRMERTKLWRIIRGLPKGALLHAHFDAMADLDFVFAKAFSTDGIHICSQEALCTPSALEKSPVLFQYSRSAPQSNRSIWSSEYQPSTLIQLSTAADNFPNGGRSGFLTWIKERCSITVRESLNHHHGPNAIWQKFKSTFVILGSIIFYEPIFRAFVREMCRQLLDDGVRWVDVRAAFVFQYRREGSEIPEEGYEEMIRVFGEEVEIFKASPEGKKFWGARMIWTSLRNLERREIVESMKQCIAVKTAYPHLIAGFDLVGQEELGRPLKDLTPELFWFRKRCVEEEIEIPFFFHAGECLGDGDETDQNLFDALLLGTRRIGHGFSLYKHPLLIDMIKDKRILVESCPISNEILRLTSSIMSHPLPALLARGVPVALCNDDPSILGQGTNGMTHDFWQALQGWKNLGLEGLGALAENSVRWAAFEDQSSQDWIKDIKDASFGNGVRASRMKEWRIEWEVFCEWIVAEFGGQACGDHQETVADDMC
ncbi:MAG: hypothetical protein M1813_006866 [Trichoglossum hirsutum]|nr:MAG: hypothetical protein M1813_006866 [Trichoglossum hirsutum]